ncbi:uncharacterized protein LOC121375244 [Gigantopelta aegis]|uniref:uncharacterized protein LOC121375244 n=1 Tax=Gigantopelta aegis TaxID=1735272 RepID=UPI001B88D8D1|nr:uncharacterized protein LOC121375244 [Gigantopelta aegis]
MAGRTGQVIPNGSVLFHSVKSPSLFMNGTLIQLQLKEPYRDSELNELLYVIVVIVFYATGLMTLIITQIRKQRREGSDIDYYDEYLQRNQEVKRTCRNAMTVVAKPPGPRAAEEGNGGDRGVAAPPGLGPPGSGSIAEEGRIKSQKKLQTELSPMLEPIADEDILGSIKEFQV